MKPRTYGLTALLYLSVMVTAVFAGTGGTILPLSHSQERHQQTIGGSDRSGSLMLCDGCYRGVLGRLTTQAPVDLAGLGSSIRAQSDSDVPNEENGGFQAFLRWYLSQER